MKLKTIVVALAAALSASAYAGDDHVNQPQPRAQGADSGVTQPQAQDSQQQGREAQAQSPELVKQAQQALKDKGIQVGAVDGQWGPQTQQGVKQFQQQQGLQASGQLDQQTVAALGIGGQSSSAGGSSRGSAGVRQGVSGSSSGMKAPAHSPSGSYNGDYSEGSK